MKAPAWPEAVGTRAFNKLPAHCARTPGGWYLWTCPISSIELGESQAKTPGSLKVLRTWLLYQNVCLTGGTASVYSWVIWNELHFSAGGWGEHCFLQNLLDYFGGLCQTACNATSFPVFLQRGILMHRWRYPSLSLHGIEGAFSASGAKTVIPRKVIGKFSIRLVPNMTPEEVTKHVCCDGLMSQTS